MIANYHTHTTRCQHAFGEDKEYVEAAIQAGIQVLGFSDHCPWVFPDGFISDMRMRPEEIDGYFYSLESLRREYARDITIYIGFESEYLPDLIEEQNHLLAQYPVDYMILGEHFLASEMCSPYTGRPNDSEQMLIQYVDTVIAGMETGKYLYTAHPDLFDFTGDNVIYHREYLRLCQYLKAHDIPVEINLLGIADHRHYTSERFLRIAQEAGNSVIISCDAHSPQQLMPNEASAWAERLAKKLSLPIVDFLPGLEPK